MKYLIILLTMFAVVAQAEEMPKYLKDGVITVTLKNGKTYTYSANEYKVVRRGAKAVPVQVSDSKPAPMPEAKAEHKNRISVVVGYGLNGRLKDSNTASTVDVEQRKGVVGGVVLQHDLNKDYHIMGGTMTNTPIFLGVGKSW